MTGGDVMVQIVVDEARRETVRAVIKGIGKYRKVGNSGYIRVKLEMQGKEIWASHWGSLDKIRDIYEPLQVGDEVDVTYVTENGKGRKRYRILQIAPAPKEEKEEKKRESGEGLVGKKVVITKEMIKYLNELVMYMMDIKDEVKKIHEKVDYLYTKAQG